MPEHCDYEIMRSRPVVLNRGNDRTWTSLFSWPKSHPTKPSGSVQRNHVFMRGDMIGTHAGTSRQCARFAHKRLFVCVCNLGMLLLPILLFVILIAVAGTDEGDAARYRL